jgi:hypothetical protein
LFEIPTSSDINHAKISNVKEEKKKKKKKKGYRWSCVWSVNAPHTSTTRKSLKSVKERKSKVNKILQSYSKCCLKILRERETLGIGKILVEGV